MGIGFEKPWTLGMSGENLKGSMQAVTYLEQINDGQTVDIGNKVVVVGGGNVAIDVALTALRVGAKEVQLACLESREEMPAFEWEIEQALEEGVKVNVSWGPKKLLGDGKKVKGSNRWEAGPCHRSGPWQRRRP